jgi:hypothetical protein
VYASFDVGFLFAPVGWRIHQSTSFQTFVQRVEQFRLPLAQIDGNDNVVLISGRLYKVALQGDEREQHPNDLQRIVRITKLPEIIRSARLKPNGIIGVVRNAHFVRLGISHGKFRLAAHEQPSSIRLFTRIKT